MSARHGSLFHSTNMVRVSGDTLAFTAGEGGHTPVGGALARRPFTRRYPYFEITITSWGNIGAIGIGASSLEFSLGQMPGWKSGSVGFHADDGKLYAASGSGTALTGHALKVGDTMGCGVVFSSTGTPEQVFFALNGNVVGRTPAPGDTAVLHPHIGFHSVGEKVTFNFKARSPLSASGAAAGFVRRRTAPAPRGARQLQELGLRLFGSIVASFGARSANAAGAGAGAGAGAAAGQPLVSGEALAAPLQAVAAMLEKFEPMQLFPEWSPPRDPVQERLDLTALKATPVATSESKKAENALQYRSTNFWQSDANRNDSHWAVKLREDGAAVNVSSVQFEFETSKDFLPEWFEIELSVDGDEYTKAVEVRGGEVDKINARHIFWIRKPASHVRIKMHGYAITNKDKCHAIRNVYVNTIPETGLQSTSASNLATLRSWLTDCVAAGGSTATVSAASLRALQGLGLATGSLVTVLNLVMSLLDLPTPTLPPTAVRSEFTEQLHSYVDNLHKELSLREMMQGGASLSEGGSSGGMAVLNTTFDPSVLPSGCVLSNNNMTVRCNSGSGVVVCNNAPFTTGKGAWEFILDEDSTGGQCSCFGAAMCRPVTSQSYNSAQCWMYRSYNGYKYQNGQTVGSAGAKIVKGNKVRCEVDMDAGTMRIIIEGQDQGICFTNLAGQTVYPAVAFYSSGRQITLVKVEGPGSSGGGAASTTALDTLEETSSYVGHGDLGKGGELGYENLKVKVGGLNVSSALSMHPPSNDGDGEGEDEDGNETKNYAHAAYDVGKKYQSFSGSVAVSEEVDAEKLRTKGSPVTFTILADGEEIWKSEPVTKPNEPQQFDVSLLAVKTLELRTAVANNNNYCHAVWVSPVLTHCRQWKSDGWNNDADTFVCPINNATRGKPTPLPPVAKGDLGTPVGLAVTTLSTCGLLAEEYLRDMCTLATPDGAVASLDLEAPYSIEAERDTFVLLRALLAKLLALDHPLATDAVVSVLRIAKANLRRLVVSQVDPAEVGVYRAAVEEENKDSTEEGDTKTADEQTKESVIKPLGDLLESLVTDASRDPRVRAEASEAQEAGLELFLPQAAERNERVASLVTDAAVLELQLAWPCDAVDQVGDRVKFERAVLQLQLDAKRRGWRTKVHGRWPALLYLVMDIPSGTVAYLDKGFGETLFQAGIDDWSFPDGLPTPELRVKVERIASWSRVKRLATETTVGVARVYPAGVASFDDVCASIESFLPRHSSLVAKEASPSDAQDGADAGVGAGAGAGAAAGSA